MAILVNIIRLLERLLYVGILSSLIGIFAYLVSNVPLEKAQIVRFIFMFLASALHNVQLSVSRSLAAMMLINEERANCIV